VPLPGWPASLPEGDVQMGTLLHTCRALALLAVVLGTGCGMRTSIQAEADAIDDGPVPNGEERQPCGSGPPCDRESVGTRTCESLGLGSGVLSCDPLTCNLDISQCSGGALDGGQPPIGTGGPGTPGLFGSAAGTGATPGFFGAGGQGGLFGAGNTDGGFFGAGNNDGGFFGAGNFGGEDDGGTDEPGGGFFGGN